MAVEKMMVVNIASPVEKTHEILKNIVLSQSVHILNYSYESKIRSLTMETLNYISSDYKGYENIRPYGYKKYDFKELLNKISDFSKKLGINFYDAKAKDNYDFSITMEKLNKTYNLMLSIYQNKDVIGRKINEINDFINIVGILKDSNYIFKTSVNMKNFNFRLGTLTKEMSQKLKANYENIPAIILHAGKVGKDELYLIYTLSFQEEIVKGLLKSFNFKKIELPKTTEGEYFHSLTDIKKMLAHYEDEYEKIDEELAEFAKKYKDDLNEYYNEIKLEEKIAEVSSNVCVTDNFMLFTGWVPFSKAEEVKRLVESEDVIVSYKDSTYISQKTMPPTKLINNKIIKPFELLVNMYGIPSYKEMDPTLFFGITYCLFFGAMFGDVGQGLVFVLAGLWLKYKKNMEYGGILSRIGLSSTIFGFIYGSVFGKEDILSPLILRPMDSINIILGISVILGIILILISFGISLYNGINKKEYEEVVFGRNGVSGLLFYLGMLIICVQMFLNINIIPNYINIALIIIGIIAMILKKPLYGKITHKKPVYEEGKSAYFIEGGFDLIETVLSLLSNTISFIRVGAFALNHAGLFLAFTTMAEMVNNDAASVIIFLVANIIIICLEGLIVFIQGLRLEYYELFSKYFDGTGKEYLPVKIINKNK